MPLNISLYYVANLVRTLYYWGFKDERNVVQTTDKRTET